MAIDLRFQLDIPISDEDRARWTKFGFRIGDKGTHTTRTIMQEEITTLLATVPAQAQWADYVACVVDDNCLGKRTLATRKLTVQRLREIYGLNPEVSLFRIFRSLWDIDEASRSQLACLMGLARDPLLRITMPSVSNTPIGDDFQRRKMTDALLFRVEGRLNESTVDKVVRNASSSWTQSGHLWGRTHKIRVRLRATSVSSTFALLIAYVFGKRGFGLLENPWTAVLDAPPEGIRELAVDAKRLGLLDLKQSGNILDISFPHLLVEKDRELIHGTH